MIWLIVLEFTDCIFRDTKTQTFFFLDTFLLFPPFISFSLSIVVPLLLFVCIIDNVRTELSFLQNLIKILFVICRFWCFNFCILLATMVPFTSIYMSKNSIPFNLTLSIIFLWSCWSLGSWSKERTAWTITPGNSMWTTSTPSTGFSNCSLSYAVALYDTKGPSKRVCMFT